jgi:arginyl-tRNA--protein-N-Asp/Glu arginylyltransferase
MRDKSYPKRSLGLAVIDATIQHFQNMGNNYYYIGHANRATSRLSYKYSLPALEELKDNQWSKL